MPSSYTTSLKLTLPQTGELTGTWGNIVNSGITSLVDQAVAGSVTITMTANTPYTLTSTNGTSDQARNMFVNITGGPHTSPQNVICPSVSKLYVVTNSTSGGQAIVFKTSAGTGVSISSGARAMVYCNGTNVTTIIINGTTDAAISQFTGSLALTSPDASVATIADTAGFSGFSAGVQSTAQSTVLGMYGNTATGTTSGVSRASLGLLSFGLASSGLIQTTFPGAPLYFATDSGLKMAIRDTGFTALYGNGTTAGGELRFNNPDNTTYGGFIDVPTANIFRVATLQNNSELRIGQIGAGLTGGTITFYTQNTERLRFESSGIAVFSKPVVVLGDGSTVGGEFRLSNPDNSTVGAYFDVDTANITRLYSNKNNSVIKIGQIGSSLTGGVVSFFTENLERMRVSASGTIGINTSTPNATSTVNIVDDNRDLLLYAQGSRSNAQVTVLAHNSNSTAGSYSQIALWNNSAFGTGAGMQFYSTGSATPAEFRLVNAANAPMTFYTNNTERMRITSTGALALYGNGSTVGGEYRLYNPDNASVGGYLDVATADILRLFSARDNSDIRIGQIGTALTGGTINFYTANTARVSIGATGQVTLFGNGSTAGGELRINNPDNSSIGGYIDVATEDIFRMFSARNDSDIRIGQIGSGLTGGIVKFYTANTERVRVDSSGRMGIGTGSSALSSKLTVAGVIESTTGGIKFPDDTVITSTQGMAKAWVSILITDFSPFVWSTLDSFGISTVVAIPPTGGFLVTFSSAFGNANYAYAVAVDPSYVYESESNDIFYGITSIKTGGFPSTTQFKFYFIRNTNNYTLPDGGVRINLVFFGD